MLTNCLRQTGKTINSNGAYVIGQMKKKNLIRELDALTFDNKTNRIFGSQFFK